MATVLIILIIIAVVAILWAGVFSMIKSEAFLSSQSDIDLTIDTIGGYTYWDQDLREACVRVKRGADDIYLTKINVLFSIKGNSVEDSFTKLPQAGGAVMECFGPYPFKPDSVKVVPIFIRGNVEIVGESFSTVFDREVGSGDGGGNVSGNESVCGNNICEIGEIKECPEDCSCGDGICQYHPCVGTNCPIPESFETCPGDCPICVPKCGDDICQEVTCLGSGCPCPESLESCPGDCFCGDKICNVGESFETCPNDCVEIKVGETK